MTMTTVSLNKLILSPRNARKTYADEDLESLADNIHERGLHQNLVVSEGVANKGIFEVDAGGRRWRALQRNVRLKRIARDWPVPVRIVPRDDAAEASLDENLHKIALNPADELTAFATIIAGYEAAGMDDPAERIAQCARRRGVSVRHVEQRLRLAALAPDILEALRTGRITLDAAKAYAGHPDQALQAKAFAAEEKKGDWGHSVQAIRDAIKRRIYPADHKAIAYVGLDAYLAAGGRIEADLFMGAEDRQQILDPSIVDRLVEEKAGPEATRLAQQEGWQDGVLRPWQTESWAEPPAKPKGYRYCYVGNFAEKARGTAMLWFALKADGSGIEAMDYAFARAEAGEEARRAASVDEETLYKDRQRKLAIETIAARLAVPAITGTPLEGRAFWPARDYGIDALSQDEDGDFEVALLVKVPAADVAAARERAEWQLAEQEAAASAAKAPETNGEGAPAEARVEEAVS